MILRFNLCYTPFPMNCLFLSQNLLIIWRNYCILHHKGRVVFNVALSTVNFVFLRSTCINLIFMVPCIAVWLSKNTNKMQLCNIIYYSKVYWRLNVFRAAHRSSSGALNCICSLWFIYPCGDQLLSKLSGYSTCILVADPSGCTVYDVGLCLLAC
jgi:hypothetical protein